MNAALLTVTLSAAVAAAAVAVRARTAPARVERPDDWHPHVSSGCGR